MISYYDKHVQDYIEKTKDMDVSDLRQKFKSRVESVSDKNVKVLDFGCGFGRDANVFINQFGWDVDAWDASLKMKQAARRKYGIHVKQKFFKQLREVNKYDGIWAMSSIVHLHPDDLKVVFKKMLDALKNKGVIFTSFINLGSWSYVYDEKDRRFVCFNKSQLASFVENCMIEFQHENEFDTFEYEYQLVENDHYDEDKSGWVSIFLEIKKREK